MLDVNFSFFLSRTRALNKVKIIKRFNERYSSFRVRLSGWQVKDKLYLNTRQVLNKLKNCLRPVTEIPKGKFTE